MAEALKDRSMLLQKEMIASHFDRLEQARENGEPVVYTFVPGNLTELIRSFGALPVLPEINALQSGMRKLSGDYVAEAERAGHSEDVCTYVKCDIGMMRAGNMGPMGTRLPKPDLLLLSYTGCYTFMKWFELLREEYDCPVGVLPRAVPGRRGAGAGAPRVHAAPAPGAGDSRPGAGHRPALRRGEAAASSRPLGRGGG